MKKLNLLKLIILLLTLGAGTGWTLPQEPSGTDEILNKILRAVDDYLFPIIPEETITISELSNRLSHIETENLKLPISNDFESLQKHSRILAGLLIQFAEKNVPNKQFGENLIAVNEILFKKIDHIQNKINLAYADFSWQNRLSNMLPYLQTRTALDHAMISLLDKLTSLYPYFQKQRFWSSIDRYLNQIHVEITDIGQVNNELHTLVILNQLLDTCQHLDTLLSNEKNSFRSIIKTLRLKQKETAGQIQTIEKKRNKFLKKMGLPPNYFDTVKPAPFEQMYQAYTADEWFQRGLREVRPKKKIAYFTKAIELRPDFSDAYVNRGGYYQILGDFEKAIQDYSSAIAINPDESLAYANRGKTFLKRKQYQSALSDFSRVLSVNHKDGSTFLNRAICYIHLDHNEKALADLNKAIAMDSLNVGAYNYRGIVYRNLNQYTSSLQDHRKAIELDPLNAVWYYNLGSTYWKIRRWKEVVEAWKKCLELDPDFPVDREYLAEARYRATQKRTKTITEYE